MNKIDEREYGNLLEFLGYVNEDEKADMIMQIEEKKIILTDFEKTFDEAFEHRTFLEKDLLEAMKDKTFTMEEKAALYHRLVIIMLQKSLYSTAEFRPLVEKAMKYDEKHHYDLALITLLLDFYNGKDDIVKKQLENLPENTLTILLKGYYSKDDGKAIMDRIFDYDPMSYFVFAIPEIKRYLGRDERDVLSLNTAFMKKDSFIIANTYKIMMDLLVYNHSSNFMEAYNRFKALNEILHKGTPNFEDRFSKDVIALTRYGAWDVTSLIDNEIYDASSDLDGTIDEVNEFETFNHSITKEEFLNILNEAEKYNLAHHSENGDLYLLSFPFFGMIFLDKYFKTRDKEKEIFAQVKPGEVPYYKISFNMTQPKGAIQRQFFVRYDMNLYDFCREFLYSIGVDEIDHQCGFMTRTTKYDCPYPTIFGNDGPQTGMVDARDIRPYEVDSNTALFTYDYIQNWDFKMTISDSPISRKDIGSCVLTKAKGYRLIPDAHNAFYAFYNGEKLDDFFNPFLKDEKGKLISRDVFFGPFKPEEVIHVPHCYYEDDDEEEGDDGAYEEETEKESQE